MNTQNPPEKRSCLLAISSILLVVTSLPCLGLAIFFGDTIGWMADSGGLILIIGLLIGVCAGIINLVGIILGGFGIFFSRQFISIIGILLNLIVLVKVILFLISVF